MEGALGSYPSESICKPARYRSDKSEPIKRLTHPFLADNKMIGELGDMIWARLGDALGAQV